MSTGVFVGPHGVSVGANGTTVGRTGTGGDPCCCCHPDCGTTSYTVDLSGLLGGANPGCVSGGALPVWTGLVTLQTICGWYQGIIGGGFPSAQIDGFALAQDATRVGNTYEGATCEWNLVINCYGTSGQPIWSGTKTGGNTAAGIYVTDGTGSDPAATLTVS